MISLEIKRLIIIAALTLGLASPGSQPALAVPSTSSQYVCLMDAGSGQVLYGRHMDEKRPVASTTKMMSAIVAVEYARLDEKAVVSQHADQTAEYTIGLKSGAQLTVEELLKVALLRSANDAAVVLAEYVAGDEMLFAHLMSLKAFAIGAVQTRYDNASGLPGNQQYSTAYDLAVIGRYLMTNPILKSLAASKQAYFKHPAYEQPLLINNTNTLLFSYPGADGIKTGTTDAAGKCLVASATRQGRQLIAVALRSADRSADCARLLDYGFKETQAVLVVDKSEPFKKVRLSGGQQDTLLLYPDQDIYLWLGSAGTDIEKRVCLDYDIKAPVTKNQNLGKLSIYAEGKPVATANLTSADHYPRGPGLTTRILRALGQRWGLYPGVLDADP